MGKNTLKLETSGFSDLIEKIKAVNGNVKKAVDDALTQAGETITVDTLEALDNAYLPAKGKYSKEATKESVVQNPAVVWHGDTAEIAVGFDYGKKGAGGLLITGTPKMKPDKELQEIYKKKRYINEIHKDIENVLNDYVQEAGG